MGLKTIAGGFGMALALLLAPLATAQDADAPAAEQPAAVLAEPALLEQLGVDGRASGELSAEELQKRIDKLAAVLEQADLADDAKEQVSALLEADRKELEQRQAAAATPSEVAPEQPAAAPEESTATTTEAPAPTTEEAIPPPAEPTAETTTAEPAQQPAEQPAGEQAPPPADGAATTATESAPAAEQPAATTVEQPAAEQPATTTVEQPAAPVAETPAEQPAAEATTAQPAPTPDVEAPPEVSPEAETKAAALLADETPAESLTDAALKARVEQYRDLLGEAELSRKTAKALRARLKTDRAALRARVAAQEAAEAAAQQAQAAAQPEQQAAQPAEEQKQPAATQVQQGKKKEQQALVAQPGATAAPEDAPLEIAPLLPLVLAPTLAEIPLLLADRRPARELADDDLNRRILATREAVQDEEDYSQDELTLFDRQLRQDRQELNSRLVANREARAVLYEAYEGGDDLGVDINTAPEPGEPRAPNSIFAAEVDDAEMWDQLVAAPLEPLPRRYSRHDVVEEPEFVMNLPEVREAMPSIELDTITFGFNEAFVREEEIFDLDRIARMIERLVAAHPDEIFMIEGHTDAVGSDAYNLRLSRQRAQAVKAAFTRYYVIAAENLATAGMGERYLKIWTPEAEEENRRVTVRRVTPLVQGYEGEE